MALRGRRIENFLELWWLVASRVVGIWVSSTSFQKSDICWPQQPPTEIVLISVKKWIFDDPFPKKGPVLVILVPVMIQPSQSVMFLMKWGCKGHWGHRGCWGCGGHWGCRGSKVWKISTEYFRVIQILEFSFVLTFWKFFDLVDSWNIILKFTTLIFGGCWGQPMSFFWKLVDETQMPTTLEATSYHSSRILSILLPLRAIQNHSFHYETPFISSTVETNLDLVVRLASKVFSRSNWTFESTLKALKSEKFAFYLMQIGSFDRWITQFRSF
jgi:hypothetical protein